MIGNPLIDLILAAVLLTGSTIALVTSFRAVRQEVTSGDAHWDEDCPCCQADCGDVDEESKCVICLH